MGLKEDIGALDAKVSRLKTEYEQYFMKVLKREPAKLRAEVDRLVLYYTTQTINNTSLRFRLNTIISRYNTYKHYWNRVLRGIEEGTFYRDDLRKDGDGARDAASGPAREVSSSPPDEGLKEVYERYIEARRSCNESVEGLSFEAVKRSLKEQIDRIEGAYRTREVEFKVYVKDGKARLAIAPKAKAP